MKNAFCFCLRVPRKQTRLLSELHFALVSPAVLRMLPSDFGAISNLDSQFPNCKARLPYARTVLQHVAVSAAECTHVSLHYVGVLPRRRCTLRHEVALVVLTYLGTSGARTETKRQLNGVAKVGRSSM